MLIIRMHCSKLSEISTTLLDIRHLHNALQYSEALKEPSDREKIFSQNKAIWNNNDTWMGYNVILSGSSHSHRCSFDHCLTSFSIIGEAIKHR